MNFTKGIWFCFLTTIRKRIRASEQLFQKTLTDIHIQFLPYVLQSNLNEKEIHSEPEEKALPVWVRNKISCKDGIMLLVVWISSFCLMPVVKIYSPYPFHFLNLRKWKMILKIYFSLVPQETSHQSIGIYAFKIWTWHIKKWSLFFKSNLHTQQQFIIWQMKF